MADQSRLSLDIADLPLTPFGMRSPLQHALALKTKSQTGLTKLSRLQAKSPPTGPLGENLPPHSPKVSGKENVSSHAPRAVKKIQAPASQRRFLFWKPLHAVKKGYKLPALAEEDSDDVFLSPSPHSKKLPVSRNKNNDLPTNKIIRGEFKTAKKNLDYGSPSETKAYKVNNFCGTTAFDQSLSTSNNVVQINSVTGKRRDSQFTDIDDGSFVEFTSEIPEGRIIPHTDSLVALRNNLYFTCQEYTNETEYSTSSKTPAARYNFHHMIDALKKQQLQPQISEVKFSSTASPSLSSKSPEEEKEKVTNEKIKGTALSCKVLNSTMINGKQQTEVPFIVPDISTLTLEDSPENPTPILPRSRLLPQESNANVKVFPSAAKSPNGEDSSLISEDVLLASSNDESSKEFEVLPDKRAKKGNHVDEDQKSAVAEEASKDEPPSLVHSAEHQPSRRKDFRDIPLSAEEESNQTQAPGKDKIVINAAQLINPISIAPPDFGHLRKSVRLPILNSNEKENQTPDNSNPSSNGTPSKVCKSGAVCTATVASPKKFSSGVFPSGKGVSKTPKLQNYQASSATRQTPLLPVTTTSQSCAPTKLLSAASPATLPKSSVCKWVISSPFKDSSFGTSFAKKLATESKNLKNTSPSGALVVLETSDESSDEDDHSKNAVFDNKKRALQSAREIRTPPGNLKLASANLTSERSKVPGPEAAPKSTPSVSDDEFDKIIENSSNLESLKLRLEASSRTHATALTLGRIAKQCHDTSGDNLVSERNVLPDLQQPTSNSGESNDDGNERRCKQEMVSKNPYVTERKKKKNGKTASISKKLFESPLQITTSEGSDTEIQLLSSNSPSRAQKFPKSTSSVHGKNVVDESSDSDELCDYLSKWRKPQNPPARTARNEECLSNFFTDDESSGEEINYRLIPPSSSIVRKMNRNDTNSVSEFLSENNNKTKQLYKKQIVNKDLKKVTLSDTNDSLPTLKSLGLPKPSTNIVHLSDSDDDDDVQLLSSPIVCKTPQPIKKNKTVKVCPKTDIPIRKKNNHNNFGSKFGTPSLSFLASLSTNSDNLRLHPDALAYKKNFAKNKEQLTDELYKLFNEQVFNKKLPQALKITWNVRMTKTAGFCYYQIDRSVPSGRCARIELSTKVVDNSERLRDTLIHELCHAAAWIISGYKDGHGPLWRTWASRALSTFPELPNISRCHNYEISCKFTYQCTKCGYSIGRHSKSLDTERKVCGKCHGRFELLPTNRRAETAGAGAGTPRTPGPFALFVKENYGSMKKNSDLKHSDIMKVLGEKFRMMKT